MASETNTYIIRDGGQDAIAFIPRLEMDLKTIEQIKQMIIHPAVIGSKIRVMPDCHRGTGCCVGFTYTMTDKIVPSFVGGDIGCGVLAYPIDPQIGLGGSLEKVERRVRNCLQMGNGNESIWPKPIAGKHDLDQLYIDCQEQAQIFASKYKAKFGADISQYIPQYDEKWLKSKCNKIGSNYEKDILRSLGTLGGGNHYIEINQDPDNEESIYISIHSGSRYFGSAICMHHQKKINEGREFPVDYFDEKATQIERTYKNPKTAKLMIDQVRKEIAEKKHPNYLEGDEAYEYYMDMIFCQNYAKLNRRLILKIILEILCHEYDEAKIIESIHNYIDFNDFIVRKGAIAAYKGRQCIVALNMRDGILLCEGSGNENWNYSSAHGAGRLLSRTKAINSLSMKQFKKDMEKVCTSSVSMATLDESPRAYKDSDFIKGLLAPSVTIKKHLISIINWKSP